LSFAIVPTKLRAKTMLLLVLLIRDHDANLVRSQYPYRDYDFLKRSTFHYRRNFAYIRAEAPIQAIATLSYL